MPRSAKKVPCIILLAPYSENSCIHLHNLRYKRQDNVENVIFNIKGLQHNARIFIFIGNW